jgi:hypothetical protein
MSWLFSQALVEAYSEESYLVGEQFAPLNGKPTQQAYCAPDKMTEFSRLSRFGMTFKPFLADRGKDLLTLYLEDFHAKTLVPQEKAQELMENDQECGEKWRGSFVKYDPDTFLWKTHQCSLLGDLDKFSETWPQWGLMRNGECWEQRTLERRIRGTESGLSPNGVDNFHTPNTTGLDGGSNSRRALRKKMGLPTPNSRDWKDGQTAGNRKSPGLGVVAHWPTPVSDDTSHRKNKYAQGGTALSTKAGGQLNPTWVEWLMGWPLGWTDLKPLVMGKCLYARLPLGESSQEICDGNN